MSLYNDWLTIRGLDSSSASQASKDENDVRLFTSLNTSLVRYATAKDKIATKQGIANLKAEVKMAAENKRQLTEFAKIEGRLNDTKLDGLARVQSTLIKSYSDYYAKAATPYSPVIRGLREGARIGGNQGAWSKFAGSFFSDPNVVTSRKTPQYLATFRKANSEYGSPFEIDPETLRVRRNDDGSVYITDSGRGVLAEKTTMAQAIKAAEDYDDGVVGQQNAIRGFENASASIEEARKSLAAGDIGNANTAFATAANKLELANANAQGVAGIDPDTAMATIEKYKQKDKEFQDVKAAWGEARDRVFGGDGDDSEKWKSIVGDTQYQQWAKDRGFNIGYVSDADQYVAGGDDQRALTRWFRESKKAPGKYSQLTTKVVTDELIQVVDANGDVIGRGYRMASHAADRKGTVRMIASGNRVLKFTKDQIGEVQLLSAPTEVEPSFIGSARASKRAEAELADVSQEMDIEATKAAELVTDTQYAVRQDEMGKSSYLTKEEYSTALSQIGYVTASKVGSNRYLISGDRVFAMSRGEDGATQLTAVEDEATIKAALESKDIATPRKAGGSALVASDIMDGDQVKASLEPGFMKRPATEEADVAAAKNIALSSYGITLTETAKPIISGLESEVGGTTYVDARGKVPKTTSTVPSAELEAARAAAEAEHKEADAPIDPSIFSTDLPEEPLDIDAEYEPPPDVDDTAQMEADIAAPDPIDAPEPAPVPEVPSEAKYPTYSQKSDIAAGEDPVSQTEAKWQSALNKKKKLDGITDKIKKKRESDPDFSNPESWPTNEAGDSIPPRLIARSWAALKDLAAASKDMGLEPTEGKYAAYEGTFGSDLRQAQTLIDMMPLREKKGFKGFPSIYSRHAYQEEMTAEAEKAKKAKKAAKEAKKAEKKEKPPVAEPPRVTKEGMQAVMLPDQNDAIYVFPKGTYKTKEEAQKDANKRPKRRKTDVGYISDFNDPTEAGKQAVEIYNTQGLVQTSAEPGDAERVRSVLRPDEKKEPGFFSKIGAIFRKKTDTPTTESAAPATPPSPTPDPVPGTTGLTTEGEVAAAGTPVTAGAGMAETLKKNKELREREAQRKREKEARESQSTPPPGIPNPTPTDMAERIQSTRELRQKSAQRKGG